MKSRDSDEKHVASPQMEQERVPHTWQWLVAGGRPEHSFSIQRSM